MPRRKLTPTEQKQREMEAWDSKVNPTGKGEDPAIQALQGFEHKTNLEAFDIALELQKIIRGQNSLMENQNKFGEEIAKMRQRMAEMDEQAVKWENDRQAYLEEMERRADRLRLTEAGQEKVRAQAAIDLAEETGKARARMAVDKQEYDAWLARQPLETVVSPGVSVIVNEGGRPTAKLLPEEVRIKHRIWLLPPGVPTDVPQPVAEYLRQRRRSQAETRERQNLMARNLESSVLEQKQRELDKKYGSSGSLGAAEAASAI